MRIRNEGSIDIFPQLSILLISLIVVIILITAILQFYHITKEKESTNLIYEKNKCILREIEQLITEKSCDGKRYLLPNWESILKDCNSELTIENVLFQSITIQIFEKEDLIFDIVINVDSCNIYLSNVLPAILIENGKILPVKIILKVGL